VGSRDGGGHGVLMGSGLDGGDGCGQGGQSDGGVEVTSRSGHD
jgi:hypothetical protein